MWKTLGHNKGSSVPRKLIWFDCETLPQRAAPADLSAVHKLRLGIAQSGRWRDGGLSAVNEQVFTTADEFWRFVGDFADTRSTTWLFAHSALFDLRCVEWIERMTDGRLVIDKPRIPIDPASKSAANNGGRALAVIDSPPTIICMRLGEGGPKVLVVDTLNYFKVPLAELGESINLPKLAMPAFSAPDDAWLTYCRRDVEIIREAVIRMLRFNAVRGLGNFGKTIAQTAINAYRHKWMRHKVFLHDQPDIKRLERSAYFGGRTDLFRHGDIDTTVHQYDVSGFYCSIMHDHRFPVKLHRYELRADYLPLAPAIDPNRSLAAVRINSMLHRFPLRSPRGTIYPLGQYETWLCGEELAKAQAVGAIDGWGSWAEYECAPIFRAAMADLWEWRCQYADAGAELEKRYCKLLTNAIFGKFGQRVVKWLDRPLAIAPAPWRQWTQQVGHDLRADIWRSVGWHCQQQSQEQEAAGSFVAVSAFVTAAGRVLMDVFREAAGEQNVMYQGVDSLVVDDAGRRGLHAAGLIQSDRLGFLRHQCSGSHGRVDGPGRYQVGDKLVTLGRSRTAAPEAQGAWLDDRFIVAGDLFSAGRSDGVTVQTVTVHPTSGVWKGEAQANGAVKPFVIGASDARAKKCD